MAKSESSATLLQRKTSGLIAAILSFKWRIRRQTSSRIHTSSPCFSEDVVQVKADARGEELQEEPLNSESSPPDTERQGDGPQQGEPHTNRSCEVIQG